MQAGTSAYPEIPQDPGFQNRLVLKRSLPRGGHQLLQPTGVTSLSSSSGQYDQEYPKSPKPKDKGQGQWPRTSYKVWGVALVIELQRSWWITKSAYESPNHWGFQWCLHEMPCRPGCSKWVPMRTLGNNVIALQHRWGWGPRISRNASCQGKSGQAQYLAVKILKGAFQILQLKQTVER